MGKREEVEVKVVRSVCSFLSGFFLTQYFVVGMSSRLSPVEVAVAWLAVGALVSLWCSSNLVRVIQDPQSRRSLKNPYLDGLSESDIPRVKTIVWSAYAPVVAFLWTAFLFDAVAYAVSRARRTA